MDKYEVEKIIDTTFGNITCFSFDSKLKRAEFIFLEEKFKVFFTEENGQLRLGSIGKELSPNYLRLIEDKETLLMGYCIQKQLEINYLKERK